MGLVINPTAFRIGYVKAWTDAWYVHRMHYPVFVHKSLEIKILLQYILLRSYPTQWSHWIYSHATYYYLGNKFQISLFVYDGNDSYKYFRFAKEHKYGWFRKSKFIKFWTKKQLLDLQFFYQRWFLVCQAMNFDLESLTLDNIRWRVEKRRIRKIEGLRKKYGRFWVAREELFIWKYPISIFSENSYNKMGMTILNSLFKIYMLPRIKRTYEKRDLERIYLSRKVLKSHKMFYFFFSYIEKILKYNPTYPVALFNRLTYKMIYRTFCLFFIFKPYWKNLSSLYELLLLYINVNSKIKIYILDNRHLNASYLARYIITCLRARFDYRDTMIPIRKTLLKIMLAKRWRPIKDIKKKNWKLYLERYNILMKDRIYFHLVNSDMVKMFFFRLKKIKKIKKIIRWPVNKFKIFNFKEFKKSLNSLKSYYKVYENNLSFFKNKKLFLKNKKLFFKRFIKVNVLFQKKKFIKYIFWNKNYLKKNINIKLSFFRYRIKKGFWKHLKKRLYKYFQIYLCKLHRLLLCKTMFVYIYLLKRKININFSFFKFFNHKLKKFVIKAAVWKKKRKFIKYALKKAYARRYRSLYRMKLDLKQSYLKKNLKWIAVKRWFSRKNRKRWFLAIKKNNIMLKVMNDNFIILKMIRLRNFKRKIILYNFSFKKNYKNIKNFIFYIFNLFVFNFGIYKKWFFYNKSFFFKEIFIYKKKTFLRNQSNLFFFNLLDQYTIIYKPFIFNIKLYKSYIFNVLNLIDPNMQFIEKKPRKYNLEEMPLKDKFRRLRVLEGGSNSLLYGYKFHFVGRFTRKQKAASLWFAKGANSVSSMRVDVDYGFYSLALRYSACTLKVWLYKNRGYSYKYGYRLV